MLGDLRAAHSLDAVMFVDTSRLIAGNRAALDRALAVADVDGDGQCEIVVGCADGPNRVLKWTHGALHDITARELADEHRSARAVAAGDCDGDGIEELFFVNAGRESSTKPSGDRLFKRSPEGRWVDLFTRSHLGPARQFSGGHTVTAIDRRGTGRYGFFVGSEAQLSRLHEIAPDGRLLELAQSVGLDAANPVHGALAAPLFGPHSDVFCTSGHVALTS